LYALTQLDCDRIQLATGRIQLAGALFQAHGSFQAHITQGIRGPLQATRLVYPGIVCPFSAMASIQPLNAFEQMPQWRE
jgi:hypothetical protein